jgi:actin-related protein
MDTKIPYSELKKQNEVLILESKRLKAAEQIFHRQNVSLKALHQTSLGLIDKLDKEELLENILERAASLSGTAHGYIYLL